MTELNKQEITCFDNVLNRLSVVFGKAVSIVFDLIQTVFVYERAGASAAVSCVHHGNAIRQEVAKILSLADYVLTVVIRLNRRIARKINSGCFICNQCLRLNGGGYYYRHN
ncbi:MAG: hypothetical protein K2N31_03695 [Treponemataceae bacterium]|nr:hypothetical protein [Treponemataceae bacterium]